MVIKQLTIVNDAETSNIAEFDLTAHTKRNLLLTNSISLATQYAVCATKQLSHDYSQAIRLGRNACRRGCRRHSCTLAHVKRLGHHSRRVAIRLCVVGWWHHVPLNDVRLCARSRAFRGWRRGGTVPKGRTIRVKQCHLEQLKRSKHSVPWSLLRFHLDLVRASFDFILLHPRSDRQDEAASEHQAVEDNVGDRSSKDLWQLSAKVAAHINKCSLGTQNTTAIRTTNEFTR